MDIAQVLEIGRDLLTTALLVSLPALLASLLVGLVISVLQTITSIQEQTLSFVPRLVTVALVLLFFLGWILQMGVQFTVRMLWYAAEVTR
jgi:flagellar biosynthetic protein FliQ